MKHKGKSPQYKDQKQKSDKQKANDQGDDNCDRKRPHKCGNHKGKGKAADIDHQHSHLASSSIVPVVKSHQILPQVRFICDHLMCQLQQKLKLL